jgi:hypothetical protein
MSPIWTGLMGLPGDLVLIVGAWSFVVYFPRAESGSAVQHAAVACARVAVAIALAILLLHGWLVLFGRDGDSVITRTATLFFRHDRNSYYWSITLPTMAIAMPFAIAKLRLGYVQSRRRVRTFLMGLLIGLGPVVLLSSIGSISDVGARFLRRPDVFPIATVIVFGALWTLPATTGAAVLMKGVMPLRFVIRRSLQYSLARSTLGIAIALPLAITTILVVANPHRTIASVLADGGVLWVSATALAVVLAAFRRRLVLLLDRVFLRQQADARLLITDIGTASRRRLGPRDIAESLLAAVQSACRPRHAAVLVAGHDSEWLVPLTGRADPLPTGSALVRVLQASPATLTLGPSAADGLARLLPAEDRGWSVRQDWQLLAPLHAEGEVLVGVLCLGPRSSDHPYTGDDRTTIEALCSSLGPLLASRLGLGRKSAVRAELIVGSECEACGLLFDHLATACQCGGSIIGSALPRRVADRFTVTRRIGRGGMGVVYQATEEALGRAVALKTLPELGPVEAEQLRVEARTMAALQHPGLAFVLGLETVGPLPVLVVEYLAGGTLADRLRRRGAQSAQEVVRLGIDLADALVYLHDVGVLHRDLKPSNVGFTATGKLKLLDFGVAVRVAATHRHAIAGTAMYMPPEALAGAPPSPVYDLWSLGVLLCEAWLGRHPLAGMAVARQMEILANGEIWSQTRHAISEGILATALEKALAREPVNRYQHANELKMSLMRAVSPGGMS